MKKEMERNEIKDFLDSKVLQYNTSAFIESDPISIPKKFERKEDIEIAALITATISWGQRSAIIKNAERIMEWMDYEPFHYIKEGNFDNIETGSVYRTFNAIDLKYFLNAIRRIYLELGGLEFVFTQGYDSGQGIKNSIGFFRQLFTSFEDPGRTSKHIANVDSGSSAKRLNMFLRWMVRKDKRGVDFGIWNKIHMKDLMLPLDVHTGNVGRRLGILKRKQNDWKAVEEITSYLQKLDRNDPVKYDYALFGLGVFEKF